VYPLYCVLQLYGTNFDSFDVATRLSLASNVENVKLGSKVAKIRV